MSAQRSRTRRGRRGRRWSARALGVAGLAAALVPGLAGTAAADAGARVEQTNLVSDVAGMARVTDPQLVNPWGLAAAPLAPLWVADNGTSLSTLYAGGNGLPAPFKVPLTVKIPGDAPTGIAFTGDAGFRMPSGAPAEFAFDSETGNLTAWTPFSVSIGMARTVHTTPGAVYKGLAVTGGRLYAADFVDHRIDVFDQRFQPVTLGRDAFTDPDLPSGWGPFNVQAIGGELYVAYAMVQPGGTDEQAGPGLGAVDVFDTDGHLLRRLAMGGPLNAPWGMVIAPDRFGAFSGDLLVGNFGNGAINAFDPDSGHFEGTLRNRLGAPLRIDGLWGLLRGNGITGSPRSVLFSAGIDDEAHGLLGRLDAVRP